MKKLDGLTYTPTWISHMGCLSGCTRHPGLPATDSWLQPHPDPRKRKKTVII